MIVMRIIKSSKIRWNLTKFYYSKKCIKNMRSNDTYFMDGLITGGGKET